MEESNIDTIIPIIQQYHTLLNNDHTFISNLESLLSKYSSTGSSFSFDLSKFDNHENNNQHNQTTLYKDFTNSLTILCTSGSQCLEQYQSLLTDMIHILPFIIVRIHIYTDISNKIPNFFFQKFNNYFDFSSPFIDI